MIWLNTAVVLAIHDEQIAEHGGAAGVRDLPALDSALARPQNLLAYAEVQPDLAALAAAYAFSIARNHAFVDGNKRTSAAATETFLLLNGAALTATDAELFPVWTDLGAGTLSERDLALWLRGRIEKAPKTQ